MKYLYISLFIFASFTLFLSCDKIEEPYMVVNNNPIDTNDTSGVITYVQKVLIEDFTGHTCTNCPGASEKMEELIHTYGNKIVPMAIHVGFFAQPAGSNYPEDFRTAEGTAIDDFFGASAVGLPQGMVNRVETSGNRLIAASGWGSAASQILLQNPTIGILITNTYDTLTRQGNISIKSTFLSDFNENLKIVVMLTEDSIIAPQLVDNVYTPDYEHNHMLRATLTSSWDGETIVTSSISKDEFVTKNYNFTLDPSWKAGYCNIVAYIYHESNYEVIQAEMKRVK